VATASDRGIGPAQFGSRTQAERAERELSVLPLNERVSVGGQATPAGTTSVVRAATTPRRIASSNAAVHIAVRWGPAEPPRHSSTL
jgi:hypothetical protein